MCKICDMALLLKDLITGQYKTKQNFYIKFFIKITHFSLSLHVSEIVHCRVQEFYMCCVIYGQ